MKLPNSSGLLVTGSAISAANRVFASGDCNAVTNAWLSLAITSFGVPAGATRPHQVSIANPLSVSATGGASGNAGERVSVVTAIAFNLPERMLGAAVARLSKLKST